MNINLIDEENLIHVNIHEISKKKSFNLSNLYVGKRKPDIGDKYFQCVKSHIDLRDFKNNNKSILS